jgi:hypothetical protein
MSILTKQKSWRREPMPDLVGTSLTLDQQDNVRRAAAFLYARFRSWQALAKAMAMTEEGLRKALSKRRRITMRLAITFAYVAGVKVEQIASGEWPREGACPYCGRA